MKTNIEWIPVDEYGLLPDHYETVLLYIQSEPEGYVTIGMYDYIEIKWKDFCDVNREVGQYDVVTYWAHLPAAPSCAQYDVDEMFLADC